MSFGNTYAEVLEDCVLVFVPAYVLRPGFCLAKGSLSVPTEVHKEHVSALASVEPVVHHSNFPEKRVWVIRMDSIIMVETWMDLPQHCSFHD